MMLFFLCIFIILLLLILAIFFSNIRICITNLEIDNTITNIIKDYQFEFGIYLFNKIRIIKLKINEKKIKKLEKSKIINKISKMDFNKVTKRLKNKFIYRDNINLTKLPRLLLKKLKPEISKFKLDLKIGFKDVMFTTFLIPIISTVISFVLRFTTKNINNKKSYFYKIEPIYNKNIIKLRLNCIINVKVVHIINIIYIFLIKEGRSDKYERTSYRRSYGYSHE